MKRDKKELLMNSAESLIAKKGFHSTKIEDITKNAGVAKGTFYNYFKRKEDIVFEIFSKRNQEYEKGVIEKVIYNDLDIRTKIENITFMNLLFAKENEKFYYFLIRLKSYSLNERKKDGIGEILKKAHKKRIELIMRLIEEDKNRNQTVFHNDKDLEKVIILYDVMVSEHILRNINCHKGVRCSSEELREEAKFLADLLFKGI